MRLPTVEDIEKRLPSPMTSRARRGHRADRPGGHCSRHRVRHLLRDRHVEPLPIRVARLVADRSQPDAALSVHARPPHHHRHGAIPLLLVKLWSVYPRLFIRPPKTVSRALVVDLLEKASIGVLVSASVFQLTTGALNIAQWYPWEFSFRRTHEAVAWILIGALAGAHRGQAADHPGRTRLAARPPARRPVRPSADDEHAPTRRSVLLGASAASGLAVLLTAGQTVPFLRKISVFGVRDGEGPQGLPINRTPEQPVPPRPLPTRRSSSRSCRRCHRAFTREELAALPQRTHKLPIACVEGWSRNAVWTGVSIRDLVELAGGDPDSTVKVRSMQTIGAFRTSELPADFVRDHRTLLALELNGETLSLDHGYPCRIIAPNRPGVLQTKWVRQLEVRA